MTGKGHSLVLCKHYTSNTAKSYVKNGYVKTMATRKAMRNKCDELQHHKENWNDAYTNKQDNMHNNVNTNDDVDFDGRVAYHNMH